MRPTHNGQETIIIGAMYVHVIVTNVFRKDCFIRN